MLRTNLSTRPFYNVRAVQTLLAVFGAIVLAITLFNVVRIIQLAAAQRTVGASAEAAEAEAARLRTEAAQIRSQINPQELRVVAGAANEANEIIDQRAFSWTELFSQFEATLPADVRITAVRPRYESRSGDFIVAMGVEARRAADLDAFMEALEAQAGFRNVLPIQDQVSDAGTLEAIVEGIYAPRARGSAAAPAAPAAESLRGAGQ